MKKGVNNILQISSMKNTLFSNVLSTNIFNGYIYIIRIKSDLINMIYK